MLRELYEALERLDASQAGARYRPAADRIIDLRDAVPDGAYRRITPPAEPGGDWVIDDPRW